MPLRQALTRMLQAATHLTFARAATPWRGAPAHGALCAARPGGLAWPARTVKTAARRRGRVPALAASSAAGCALAPDADVDAAIRAACELLGRAPGAAEASLVQRLHDNWFNTAADLAAMSDADAASLKLPLRLRSQVAALLQQGQAAQAAVASPPGPAVAANARAHLLPPSAEALLVSQSAHGDNGGGSSSSRYSGSSHSGAEDSDSDGSLDGLDAAAAASSAAAAAAAAEPSLDGVPIEQRRCPRLRRPDFCAAAAPRVVKRGRATTYALKEGEMPPALREEFAAFNRFCTTRFFGQQTEPIAPVTAAKYSDHMRQFLGWLHRDRGHPMEGLSFSSGLPSSGREGVTVAFDYLQWLTNERGVGVRTERMALRSLSHAAKFLYHSQSKVRVGTGDRPYSDLELVKELRLMDNAARKAERVAPRVADESLKWLDWPEYLELVQELRKECAGLDSSGRPRTPTAVAWSLQRYLIFAILSCVPDRQRTLRELEVGRNLFKEKDRWVIRHGPGDYKTGKSYGERPPLVIAPHIYAELEAYIEKWRGVFEPSHAFLFTQQNGTPMSQQAVHKLFSTTAYRLTGKRCNPHLVRDSVVTYLRGAGASERELEALAIYMGHSVEMQRDTYDRRTKQQKVEPAVELLQSLNRGVLAARANGSGSGAQGSGQQ